MSQNEGNSVHARNRAGEPRKRAAIACQSCNSKRIKCNAALMLPCSNCERSGRTCQLIESRRGQRKVKTASDPRYSVSKKVSQHASSQNPWSSDRRRSSSPPTLPRDERFEENIDITKQRAPVDPRSLVESQTVTGKDQQQKNSLETVSLQMIPASSVERGSTTKQTKWPVFVAQSPEPIVSLSPNPGDRSFSDTEARQEVMDLLLMQQVFDIPTSDTCMQFFRVFFYHVAPAYPIIDRASFLFQFAIPHHPPSWLLLQAVLFAATCHCEENLVREAGFESRSKARMTLFKRVKALYDADHEKDKFTVVQATFLMSIHWISPVDLKDNWYWLQVSINLALAINMHRSSKDSWMPPKLQILRKKLWWSLYTEDKLLAAALGRPARIHSNESDLEPLEMSDFDAEPYGFGDTFRVGLPKAIMAYPICLASLAKIAEKMGEHSSQISKPTEYSPELCTGMLQVWEAGLPEFYQLKLYERTDTIWPSMIQIAGCWLKILAYQANLRVVFPVPPVDHIHQKAVEAAYQMVHIIEDLLATERIQFCPLHVTPALYAAMTIFAKLVESDHSVFQKLAHVKYKVCKVALEELQGPWPISRWILSAFAEKMSGRSGKKSLQPSKFDRDNPDSQEIW